MKATNKLLRTHSLLCAIPLLVIIGFGLTGCPEPDPGTSPVAVTGITLDQEEITLIEGDHAILTATIEPSNASNKSVTWESDDEDVATVSDTGEVTAVAKGTATITVITADGSFEDTCAVTVKPLPASIEVTTEPTKKLYKVGEQLDLDGLEVTATFSDDSEDEIEITSNNITGFNPDTAGKQTVTVTYAELTDTFDVWVLALSGIVVDIEPGPEHLLIGQGEEIDFDDITVTATWKNESDEVHVITEAVTITMANISDFDANTVGEQTVTVTYNGKTDTFKVFVRGVTNIEVTSEPTKTRYRIGEQFDPDGLEVTATFSTDEEETVHTNVLHITGFDSTTPGTQTITVTYGSHSDTFTVKVVLVVTFNPNGGNWEGDTGNKTVEVELNETVTEPDDPTKDGYDCIFVNWYDQTFVNTFDFDTPITDNITLYAKWKPYEIGDTGPGGGKIFYRSETGFTMTDDNTTAYYLEAAPADMSTPLRWVAESYGDYENSELFPDIIGTAFDIGTGRNNTALILAIDADAPAAKACNEYSNNGKTDWFLPSRDELNELYKSRNTIGNFYEVGSPYSSSSQNVNTDIWAQRFYGGSDDPYRGDYKSTEFWVRAIRAF